MHSLCPKMMPNCLLSQISNNEETAEGWPNGRGTPGVDVQGSGYPVPALQLSASAQHRTMSVGVPQLFGIIFGTSCAI